VPERPPDDPVTSSSQSKWLLVASFILMLTVAWSLYVEFYGLRPWRSYQRRFAQAYSGYLEKELHKQRSVEKQVFSASEYLTLKSKLDRLTGEARPKDRAIQVQVELLDDQRASISDAFKDARGRVGALIYRYEVVPASDKSAKASAYQTLMKGKAKTYKVDWPVGGGKTTERNFDSDTLNKTFADIINQRAVLVGQRGENDKAAKGAQAELTEYLTVHLPGLSSAALKGLLSSVDDMDIELRQINVNPQGASINYLGGAGLVDRCQSCHIGTDPRLVPTGMTLTKADLGLAKSNDAPFSSHPEPELVAEHPIEKFGCSPCHGGNGRAIDSVTRAHGRYEHWLWPMAYPENVESGCQQCHSADMVTEHAPVLNLGRQLFRQRGCIGCHRYQGFDNQEEQLTGTRQQITQLESDSKQNKIDIPRLQKLGDQAQDNATANAFYQKATNLTVEDSQLQARIVQLNIRSHDYLEEIKKVGPDLKETRMKLRKEWIPYWIGHTHEFRPTTKMPQFRLTDDQIHAVAAFIWQSGLTGPALDHQAPGDAAHGKVLFDERGCLACHSMGEGSSRIGGAFAANLSRVGEKENYDYVVRWVHNPRQRTRPYCPFEKRDLGPEDYAKHNLPYVFDLDHSKCPNDGNELVVQQPTVMPSLRLSPSDSRDIASYLMTQKHAGATYADASYMDDPKLSATGKELVKHYGCAGCHEISGLEDEGRIGTELTNEGSKPIERLDFALWTEDAKRGILPDGNASPRGEWYDTKGFLEAKLSNPAIFDQGKYHSDAMEALRMPKPNIQSKDELNALVTFVLGSVDPTLPPSYMFKPGGRLQAVQEGWWIITKYNCIGCHQVDIGQRSVLMDLPQYQGENKVNLPPVLTSEGGRVNPNWLKGFLANPALSTTDLDRDGVRNYLQVRMPTFNLSDDEIRKIVLFFEAMSSQPDQFIPPKMEPLTAAEQSIARNLFTSPAAPCLKCHMDGNAAHDKNASAPNFLLSKERLQPAWTIQWITDPAKIIPGTAMPSGLFRQENGRWVFNGPLPPDLAKYDGDHADLLVRYMFQLTPQEQAALVGRTPAPKPSGAGGK
jgi:hypothetical protein